MALRATASPSPLPTSGALSVAVRAQCDTAVFGDSCPKGTVKRRIGKELFYLAFGLIFSEVWGKGTDFPSALCIVHASAQ